MARPYFTQGRLSVYRLQYKRPAINAPARNKVWPRKTSEELHCMREIGNPHDPTAVAIQTEIGSEIVTVGHIPNRISALTSGAGVKIKYGPLFPDSSCSIIGVMLVLALSIADDGTFLLNDPCGLGNFSEVSSVTR